METLLKEVKGSRYTKRTRGRYISHCDYRCKCGNILLDKRLRNDRVRFSCGCISKKMLNDPMYGIRYKKNLNKYHVLIILDKKSKYLGTFEDLEEAKEFRDLGIKRYITNGILN